MSSAAIYQVQWGLRGDFLPRVLWVTAVRTQGFGGWRCGSVDREEQVAINGDSDISQHALWGRHFGLFTTCGLL